ncbi:MAG: tetratricopeptide repeat protein [Sorangiineae bacterium]|nr:tetratricopeptide repeat protein [Polyangiaceae bacterium]MEB2323919.1 tetratricopeptide repeat protein [Sorangiineae bacterium]
MRSVLVLALGLAFAAPVIGCAAPPRAQNPLEYAEDAKRAYDEALDAFYDHDWETATQLFEDVKRKYGYSRYARLADLRVADIAFHQEKYVEAITGYKGFVHDYPNDAEVPYARYRVVKSLYEQSGESLLLPPLEERDLATVHEAYSTIQAFLGDYPGYDKTRELGYMLEVVTGVLARHELYVARFYLGRDNFPAAVARCQYALRSYAHSGLEPEALVLLGETYLKMKQPADARAVLESVIARYPESAFVVPARNFLGRLDRAEQSN